MRSAGYTNVHAVEIDPLNFDLFERRYDIRPHLCDVDRDRLPFDDNEVDAVVRLHLIEYVKEPSTHCVRSVASAR